MLCQNVLDIRNLRIGQELEGVVRNVVDFGACRYWHSTKDDDSYLPYEQAIYQSIKPSRLCRNVVTVWVKKIDVEREKVNLSLVAPNESN